MNRVTKVFLIVCLLMSLLACLNYNKHLLSQETQKKTLPISYLPAELDTLYQPLSRDSFILQELHDEFRNPTERLFPMEQRKAHKTWVLEFTWREKADSLITVWYIREADTLKRLRYFRYSEFDIF